MKNFLSKIKAWFLKPFKTVKAKNKNIFLSTIILVLYCSVVPFVACFTHWSLCFLCPVSIVIFFYIGYLATLPTEEELNNLNDFLGGFNNEIK